MNFNPMFNEFVNIMKKNFETSSKSTALFQEQSEHIAKWIMEQGGNVQAESKKFMEQWLASIKEQQQQYQNNLNTQLDKLEKYFGKKE